jgi:hypothetical protein
MGLTASTVGYCLQFMARARERVVRSHGTGLQGLSADLSNLPALAVSLGWQEAWFLPVQDISYYPFSCESLAHLCLAGWLIGRLLKLIVLTSAFRPPAYTCFNK